MLLSVYIFNFQKEIVEYCQMDVEILRRACIQFRKIFLEVSETDPFIAACTIASACSYVFRKKFLVPNTIGIIPPTGYRRLTNATINRVVRGIILPDVCAVPQAAVKLYSLNVFSTTYQRSAMRVSTVSSFITPNGKTPTDGILNPTGYPSSSERVFHSWLITRVTMRKESYSFLTISCVNRRAMLF